MSISHLLSSNSKPYQNININSVQLNNLTTTQRLAMTPLNGTMVYDTTIGSFFFYQSGAWIMYASTNPSYIQASLASAQTVGASAVLGTGVGFAISGRSADVITVNNTGFRFGTSGIYFFQASMNWAAIGFAGVGNITGELQVNGTNSTGFYEIETNLNATTGNSVGTFQCASLLNINAGDIVTIHLDQPTGGTFTYETQTQVTAFSV